MDWCVCEWSSARKLLGFVEVGEASQSVDTRNGEARHLIVVDVSTTTQCSCCRPNSARYKLPDLQENTIQCLAPGNLY